MISTAGLASEIVSFGRQGRSMLGFQMISQILIGFAQFQAYTTRNGSFGTMETNQMLPQVLLGRPLFAAYLTGAFSIG